MRLKLLIIFFLVLFGTKICFSEETIKSFLSDTMVLEKISSSDELPGCKKIWINKETGETNQPSWTLIFFELLEKGMKRLGYELVANKEDSDCVISVGAFGFLNLEDIPIPEGSGWGLDKELKYVSSVSIIFIDNKKRNYPEGIVRGFMSYCAIKKGFPVDDKNIFNEYLGEIYIYLLKKMLPA